MKLILTSDGIGNEIAQRKLAEMVDMPLSSCSGCIVTTASSKKQHSETALETKAVLERMGFAAIDFLDIEYEDSAKLKDYGLIYLNGGNPFYLLNQLRSRECIPILRQLAVQAVIVGTSAGAMVLAHSLAHVNELNVIAGYRPMDIEELNKDYEAVGLTDITVIPHYNRFIDKDPDFENKLGQLEDKWKMSFERVNDGEAVIVNGLAIERIHAS
ncbi:Type 1 glutamine amidotransferase-like domain-containing protein [Paenibacillus sp. NPDC056579]|uniref:Type 1 glutamine amidotransferase-like domain-containing protein n=1 Tax=Paenibacillus sp. NPDC056579 TaxID=3345871 RepID=UPI00367D3707